MSPNEEPKLVYIAKDLCSKEEQEVIQLLIDYRDVFALSFKDLKGVDPAVCQHTIPLQVDTKPCKMRP